MLNDQDFMMILPHTDRELDARVLVAATLKRLETSVVQTSQHVARKLAWTWLSGLHAIIKTLRCYQIHALGRVFQFLAWIFGSLICDPLSSEFIWKYMPKISVNACLLDCNIKHNFVLFFSWALKSTRKNYSCLHFWNFLTRKVPSPNKFLWLRPFGFVFQVFFPPVVFVYLLT